MAIFSRHMINENAKILSVDQLNKHVRGLNNANESSFSFEWEVALIYAFNKLGNVIHEPSFSETTRKIDLYFTWDFEHKHSFIADIATVSDIGYEAKNPKEYFIEQLLN